MHENLFAFVIIKPSHNIRKRALQKHNSKRSRCCVDVPLLHHHADLLHVDSRHHHCVAVRLYHVHLHLRLRLDLRVHLHLDLRVHFLLDLRVHLLLDLRVHLLLDLRADRVDFYLDHMHLQQA